MGTGKVALSNRMLGKNHVEQSPQIIDPKWIWNVWVGINLLEEATEI